MDYRQCRSCHSRFRPRAQNPEQFFCSAATCQRERRRLWQEANRRNDTDYRDNQKRAQAAWAQRNPGYWRDYRHTHPEYAERNRELQRKRQEPNAIAKKNASKAEKPIPSGTYLLSPMVDGKYSVNP